ncbi:DNA-binding protein rfx6 [Dermatophagoides pteronyssinus]|uniref:DNA-binding protein rfx6 n=1 Tax=Dermatophagoides pteronyssinus TaxID=6956 RepID=A0ABQ8J459_DERPT|nr:DNA-binding protein rfx6 [Dermatophagoides pteronyssinus]
MENSITIINQNDQEILNMNDDRIKSNQQTLKTYDWLQQTFQFRSGVSIARSLIYESYQKFCQQNNFLPICKATFGKLIRNHFPMVKSKRLGARGQSKYHYYNINFRENDRINNLHTNGRNNNNNNCEITFNGASSSSSETSSTLTILSKNKSKIIDYNHENDYNSIIQSMISFIRLPEDQLYNNDELIFTNLYKTHCQFLLDAALNENYGQMRHYIMHFWQQLPSNIIIFIDQMKSLDTFMYSSLCRLYLSLDSDDKNLQHINTIGHLMYVWIKEIFNNNSNNMNKWKLIISNQYDLGYLNTIKLNDALKWKFKIKFIVNLIALKSTLP